MNRNLLFPQRCLGNNYIRRFVFFPCGWPIRIYILWQNLSIIDFIDFIDFRNDFRKKETHTGNEEF